MMDIRKVIFAQARSVVEFSSKIAAVDAFPLRFKTAIAGLEVKYV